MLHSILLKVLPMIWQYTILAATTTIIITILQDIVQVSFFVVESLILPFHSYLHAIFGPSRSNWLQSHMKILLIKNFAITLFWFLDSRFFLFIIDDGMGHSAQVWSKQVMHLIPPIIILSNPTVIVEIE